jgi:hypothetical protein
VREDLDHVLSCSLRAALTVARAFTVSLAAAALASCGPDEPAKTVDSTMQPPARQQELPARQQRQAFESQQTISAYCRKRAVSLQSPRPPPSAGEAREAFAAAERLVDLARARPFDLVQTGVDTRLYVGDLVEDLGNVNCDPALISRLEEGLG